MDNINKTSLENYSMDDEDFIPHKRSFGTYYFLYQ